MKSQQNATSYTSSYIHAYARTQYHRADRKTVKFMFFNAYLAPYCLAKALAAGRQPMFLPTNFSNASVAVKKYVACNNEHLYCNNNNCNKNVLCMCLRDRQRWLPSRLWLLQLPLWRCHYCWHHRLLVVTAWLLTCLFGWLVGLTAWLAANVAAVVIKNSV